MPAPETTQTIEIPQNIVNSLSASNVEIIVRTTGTDTVSGETVMDVLYTPHHSVTPAEEAKTS